MELSDHLREMLKELGQAINESISGSGRVHDSIQKIRDEGYNLYMVLDAKVGVNKREAKARGTRRTSVEPEAVERSSGDRAAFRINLKDLRFLKSLGIDPTRKVRTRRAPARSSKCGPPALAEYTARMRGPDPLGASPGAWEAFARSVAAALSRAQIFDAPTASGADHAAMQRRACAAVSLKRRIRSPADRPPGARRTGSVKYVLQLQDGR
jgi:hypothetical protein